jgi:hypothetical protein
LWNSAEAELLLQLVASKARRAARHSGLAAARLLVQDWLVVLLIFYNERRRREANDDGVDVALVQCCSLRALPRLVFALSRSAMLTWQASVGAPTTALSTRRQLARDAVMLAHLQLTGLPPAALRSAL